MTDIQTGLPQPTLNSVSAIRDTNEAGVYVLMVNITDSNGETYDDQFVSRPDDPFGLGPAVRQWLSENPDFPVSPYIPPTPEELRGLMSPITKRQLRLALIRNSISISSVSAAIEAMPDGQAKEEAQVEWEDAATFDRLHPTLVLIGSSLGLTAEQIDVLWEQAKTI